MRGNFLPEASVEALNDEINKCLNIDAMVILFDSVRLDLFSLLTSRLWSPVEGPETALAPLSLEGAPNPATFCVGNVSGSASLFGRRM